jgi:hypothetical protein
MTLLNVIGIDGLLRGTPVPNFFKTSWCISKTKTNPAWGFEKVQTTGG